MMRIGDTGVVEPKDQVVQSTVELPTTQAPGSENGTNLQAQRQKIRDLIRKREKVNSNCDSKDPDNGGK